MKNKVEGGEEEEIHNSYEMYFTIVSKVNMGGSRHSLTDAYLIISLSSSIIVIERRPNK